MLYTLLYLCHGMCCSLLGYSPRHYHSLLFKAFFNFLFFHEALSDAPERFSLELFCVLRTPYCPLRIVLRVCVLVSAFAFVSFCSTKLIILCTQILCLTHLCIHECWNKVLNVGQVHIHIDE